IFTVDETKGEKQRRGTDVDGALLSAIGFGALVFAIIEGPKLGWWTPTSEMVVFGWTWPTTAAVSPVPVAFAVAIVAIGLFVICEHAPENVRRYSVSSFWLFYLSNIYYVTFIAA